MNIEHRSRFTYEYKVIQPDKICLSNYAEVGHYLVKWIE